MATVEVKGEIVLKHVDAVIAETKERFAALRETSIQALIGKERRGWFGKVSHLTREEAIAEYENGVPGVISLREVNSQWEQRTLSKLMGIRTVALVAAKVGGNVSLTEEDIQRLRMDRADVEL